MSDDYRERTFALERQVSRLLDERDEFRKEIERLKKDLAAAKDWLKQGDRDRAEEARERRERLERLGHHG